MGEEFRSKLRISAGGRVVLPAEVRQRLDLRVGSEVVLSVEDDHATLMSAKAARRRARQRARRHIPAAESLSADLMAERKKAAEGE